MKSITYLIILFGLVSQPKSCDVVTVMSYNIRLDAASDKDDNWHQRKHDMVTYLNKEKPDFFGIQEGLYHQTSFLDSMLSDYKYIGVGRDDGETAGEFMAIYYLDSWTLTRDSTIWLSEDPESPSKGWDAACYRTATVGTFVNEKNKEITIVNTHFDHKGKKARSESVDVIKSLVNGLSSEHILLMGDFNVTPEDTIYGQITSDFYDTYHHTKGNQEYNGTFNGFNLEGPFKRRIDYIFYNKKEDVISYSLESPMTSKGRQLSDHFPVKVKLKL